MNNPYLNQVHTFEDALNLAKYIGHKYISYRSHSSYRQNAIYYILVDVYLLTQAMRIEEKIERIHTSCIKRLPSTFKRTRSDFAVTMLLLSVANPNTFDRYKRYRLSNALSLANSQGVRPGNLLEWLGEQGGLEGIKRMKSSGFQAT